MSWLSARVWIRPTLMRVRENNGRRENEKALETG